MSCISPYRSAIAGSAPGLNKLFWLKKMSTRVALISPCSYGIAVRACTLNISVREKPGTIFAVQLIFLSRDKIPPGVDLLEQLLSRYMVECPHGHRVEIIGKAKTFDERSQRLPVVKSSHLFRRAIFLFCGYEDWCAVAVTARYTQYLIPSARWYLISRSPGNKAAACPRCRGPFTYGHAPAMKIFLGIQNLPFRYSRCT